MDQNVHSELTAVADDLESLATELDSEDADAGARVHQAAERVKKVCRDNDPADSNS